MHYLEGNGRLVIDAIHPEWVAGDGGTLNVSNDKHRAGNLVGQRE